ncbi:hypothetical protein BDR07DRAFT_1487789 [Suillus spraguei]|nr:hypothetical protein BDR07DRAFT_1487789 [Suillus spraguei]
MIMLSAVMEMLEHLDVVQQSFASAPAWEKIQIDDPQIQQHPLKEKARSIAIARPQPTLVAKASAGIAGAPAPAKVKHRLKPMPKTKVVPESQGSKGNDTGCNQGNSPPVYTSSQKGKGKEVVAAENEEQAVECIPIVAGQTKTLKHLKVTPESMLPMQNAPKEDIKTDTDCQELVSPYESFVLEDMAPQAPNFEPVAVAPGTNLNILMLKPNLKVISQSVMNWGGVTSDSEKTQTVCWEVLQCPKEDKVKVQGTRSEYNQGFGLKDKSKRFYKNRD